MELSYVSGNALKSAKCATPGPVSVAYRQRKKGRRLSAAWLSSPKASLFSAVALSALFVGSPALAQDNKVLLLSSDGTINIEGDLISVADGYYLIQTGLGDLRVGFDRVICQGAACPSTQKLDVDVTIGGSDVLAEGLMPLLLGGYATARGAEITVENDSIVGNFTAGLIGDDGYGDALGNYQVASYNTETAFSGLLSSEIQIGLASRRISPKEARALRDAEAGNMIDPSQEHIIAIDSLVTVVNPSNPIAELTLSQLSDIYSGKISNWSELGGPDLNIEVVRRASTSGSSQVFNTTVFGTPEDVAGPSAKLASDNVEAALFVAENPGAIAYVGHAFKRGQKPLSLVSECGIGTSPDVFSVKTEEYAMFRRLYMYNRSDVESAQTDEFLNFAKSDAASISIQQAGFIDLSVERVAQGPESPRAQRLTDSSADKFEQEIIDDLLAQLELHDRLSSTFRFRTGSANLDPRAEIDLIRLLTYLEGLPQGSEVTLVGFADSVGAFEPNLTLSSTRAKQVADRLIEIGGASLDNITINSIGYGEIAPVACNTTDSGRTINRRVETWVKNG